MLPGRIIGNPPVSHESLCIMFQRDMSILEGVGGGGFSNQCRWELSRHAPEGLYLLSLHCTHEQQHRKGAEDAQG